MALQVRWTEMAVADYKQVVDYLIQEWPISVAENFIAIVEARIKTLAVFPTIGIVSLKEPGIRSIILTKHNKLYYQVKNDYLEILGIFDTRQNPSRNKYD